MCGVVRAGVDAAGFFQVRAEIAGSGFLLDDGFLAAGVFGVVGQNFKRMQVDIAVGTIARAETAADAPIFDDDFQGIAAANRADWAAHHAKRVAALAAACGDKITIKTQAVANQARDAIVSVGAGVHAGIAARTVLQIEDEQALRFHQSLGEELINGNAVDHLQALLIGGAALGGGGFETGANAGETRDHIAKIVAGNTHQLDVIESCAGGGANAAAEETDFAEIVAPGKIGENHFAAGIIFRNFHETDSNKIKAIGGFALSDDGLAGSETLEFYAFFEMRNKFRRQVREHRHAAKMIFESAAAVGFVELRAEGLVLEHDVENVAQHFVGDDIGLSNDSGGAWVEIHTGHFAEKIAGPEVGNWIAVRKVHGCVDGDGAVARFLFAPVFVATNERAGQALEESFSAALRFDVGDWRRDRNARVTLGDVKRRRAKLAFAADDVASAEAALDDGAAIYLEECSGNALEDGNPKQLFRFENLRVRACCDGGPRKPLVGQRAGGAGNHALAAGDAGGITHRCVQVEGDSGRIAFAHAAKDKIILDLIATPNAAVAKDAGVVVDSDGEGRIVFSASNQASCKARLRDAS